MGDENKIVAFKVNVDVMKAVVNILSQLPYGQVYQVLPQFQNSEPVHEDGEKCPLE
ncbi:MAG: hypothetical protein GY794_16275 [bacterium]|nr:hypothetical protein [bacterium]